MQRKQRAAEAIAVAEKAVAALVAEAGQDRQWDEAAAFIEMGRRLHALADELSGTPPPPAPLPVGANGSLSPAAPVAEGKPQKKAAYPQFFREGDSLVKVAWSKSQRGEYEHKSPYKVAAALVESVLKAGSRGQRFTMDKLLPLRDTDPPHAQWPDYQAYVCLAWLRHEGLIKQHGRSGYSIPKPGDVAKGVRNCWDALKSR